MLLAVLTSQTAQAGKVLRFAPLPLENREATTRAFHPLTQYLAQELGEPVRFEYFDTHDEVLRAFLEERIDLVFLGPLPYVHLRAESDSIEPLVLFREPDGNVRYRCALVGFTGEELRLDQLTGKQVGLTQRLSTCGFLGANAMLQAHAGLSLEELPYRYLGSHESVLLAVIKGSVDLGSVKEEFAHKYVPLGAHILAYSDWLPATGIFANARTLSDTRMAHIRRALLDTPESVYQKWGQSIRHGMVPAEDAAFDAFRALGQISSIPPAPQDRVE